MGISIHIFSEYSAGKGEGFERKGRKEKARSFAKEDKDGRGMSGESTVAHQAG
jgi:hypothetical protein